MFKIDLPKKNYKIIGIYQNIYLLSMIIAKHVAIGLALDDVSGK